MKMKRIMAVVLTGTLLFSVPVCAANSKTAADTAAQTAEEVLATAGGTTVQSLEDMVTSGSYESVIDALYEGNISVPADIAKDGDGAAWESVIAESCALVNGVKVAIKKSEKPKKISAALSKSANQHAKAAGKKVANKGRIMLKNFFEQNAGKNPVYPLLIDKGQYKFKEGDAFLLYNCKTSTWDEFPKEGFRIGHYDLSAPKGVDMADYFDKNGELNYLIERAK